MKMNRILGIILTVTLLMSGVSFATADVADIELTGVVNQYGWAVPKDTLKVVYYVCDDDATDQQEENARLEAVAQVMKDEFNIEITKLIYAQDSTERLNMMLAGDSYPDVIVGMTDAMANTFIEQGRAVDLTPYLEKYGQNVLASYGDYINLLREEDGSLYKLSSGAGNTTDVMGRDFSIRWDWLQEAGLPVPDSFASFHDTVAALVAAHPTNANGEKVYGISAFTGKGEELYTTPLLFLGFYNAPTGIYKLNPDNSITHWVDTDEGRQVAHYINRFWQEGLLDPDFQTKDYNTSVAFMSSERVAGNIGTWWHNFTGGYQIWMSTEDNYTDDKRMANLTWEETDAKPNLITNNYIRSNRVIITDKAADPAAIMRYFDWQQTPMGIAFNSMGPAGEDKAWSIDADGNIKMSDLYWYGDPENPQFLWDDFEKNCGSWNYTMTNPIYTPVNRQDNPAEGWASPVATVNMWDLTPDYSLLDRDKMSTTNMMFLYGMETSDTYLTDMTIWTTTFSSEDEAAIILQDVKDAMLAGWCNSIMAATDEECDALYDKMVSDLHSLGLDQLVAVQQATVSENLAKLDGSFWK